MKIILTSKEMTEFTSIIDAIDPDNTMKLFAMCEEEGSLIKMIDDNANDTVITSIDDKFVTLALKIISKYTNVIAPLFKSIYNLGKAFGNELYTSLKTFATNYRKEKKQS